MFPVLLVCAARFAAAGDVIMLNAPDIVSPPAAAYYLDESGNLRVQNIVNFDEKTLRPLDYARYFNLRKDRALWLRLKLHYPRRNALIEELEPNSWYVEVPNSLLDRVHLYEQKSDGSFYPTQIAGDLVANRFWTNPAKHPLFKLRLQPGETHTVYLRLNNTTRTTVDLNIVNQTVVLPRQRMSSLTYGAVSGALLLAGMYSLAIAVFLRGHGFLLFSLYCFISLAINLAYSGVLAQYVFSSQPHAVDASHGALILLGWSVSLFFVRRLCPQASASWRSSVRWLAFAYLVCAFLFPFVPRFPYGSVMIALLVPAAPLLSLYTAWSSYRNGDSVALWALLSYALFSVLILVILCMIFGILPGYVSLEAMILFSQTVIIPPLLAALHVRTTQEQVLVLRGQALTDNDALTGLLKEPLLLQKIGAMQHRRLSERVKTAVIVLHVANLSRITLTHDSCVAEQSMLRTVIKIKRVLGDISSAARVGHARIGFVVSDVDKEEIRTLAQDLISIGLQPSRRLLPPTPLHFQFAVGFLHPVDTASDLKLPDKLHHVLDGLSSRTRRPIQFLDEYEQEQLEASRLAAAESDDDASAAVAAESASQEQPDAATHSAQSSEFGSRGFGPIDRHGASHFGQLSVPQSATEDRAEKTAQVNPPHTLM